MFGSASAHLREVFGILTAHWSTCVRTQTPSCMKVPKRGMGAHVHQKSPFELLRSRSWGARGGRGVPITPWYSIAIEDLNQDIVG